MKWISGFLLTLSLLVEASPITINATSGNDLIVFQENGNTIARVMFDTTSNGTKVLLFTASDGTPIVTLGSERDKSDVQFSPQPVDKPRYHVSVTGGTSGTHGDFRVDGTMTAGTESALCDTTTSPATCLPVDPRGGLRLVRERSPNANMGLIMLSRKNSSSGHLEESLRVGITADGFPFLGVNSTGDQPNLYFRKDTSWLKAFLCGDNQECGTLIKDNSHALKFENYLGTVTTIAQ